MGLGVSAGVAAAPTVVFQKTSVVVEEGIAPDASIERDRFSCAHVQVLEQTRQLGERAAASIGASEAEIFEAHCMMLEDPTFTDAVIEAIDGGMYASRAVAVSGAAQAAMLEAIGDDYFAARALDLHDLTDRLVRAILGVSDELRLDKPCILVAADLTPSDTAQLDKSLLRGIIIEHGGPTSHTAILARAMGIPAIVACKGIADAAKSGDPLAMDGDSGEVWLYPSDETLSAIEAAVRRNAENDRALDMFRRGTTATRDGHQVELYGNIGTPEETSAVVRQGGEGIGLFRSEFLYLDRPALPTEEEQASAYAAALERMDGKRVIIRTLDIGGDKQMPALHREAEENPFLGCRAIRLCLAEREMFQTQLRALLRASTAGKLAVMLPMIASHRELIEARTLIADCRGSLEAEGIPVADIEIGMMIETPAAAVMADVFAEDVDFFSIGTNDLTQYTLAADRGNAAVASLYDPCDPAVLRLIRHAVEAAHKHNIPCGICGEMAGEVLYTPLLVGLGIDELSMTPSRIPHIRKRISELDSSVCRELADRALACRDTGEVRKLLK